MTPPVESAYRHFQFALLRVASLIVPAKQRTEWRQEWLAELWHVRRIRASTDTQTWQEQREVTSFCLGAFQDALCLRRHSWRLPWRPSWRSGIIVTSRGSAPQCLLWLAAALAVSCAIAHLLPSVRAERDSSRYQVNPGLILIQDARYYDDSAATIPLEQFRIWKERRQNYFDGFAFYRITRRAISTEAHANDEWQVAYASSNLFALLGLPVQFARPSEEAGRSLPKAILSYEAWKREFGGDPRIAGNVLRIGRLQAVIVGVVPDGAWRLPGKVDAWLLEPDSEIASGSNGYVIAHLTPMGRAEMWTERVHISAYNADDAVYNADDSIDDLWGVSFNERTQGPWSLYLFTIFLAFLALPAVTSVSLGEYDFASHKTSWPARLIRWGFLIAKIALVLAIVYYASLNLAYWHTTTYSPASEYVQLLASFSMCLFGLRWVLLDQRRRCPVCLRRVTNPARVGVASRTFLAWNGTELICAGGHTLLHVPGLPTSWFSTQRWLYLDASWAFLFAGSGVG